MGVQQVDLDWTRAMLQRLKAEHLDYTFDRLFFVPHPYAANLKLSDSKMSAAENFVGASVSYLDGTVTNIGDKSVTHALVHVTFKDSLGQVAQAEDVPLHVLQTGGPYVEAVDLSASPLASGQSKKFRLTFEHVSGDWNHEYPELQVMDVSLK